MKIREHIANPAVYLYRLSFRELYRNRFGLLLLLIIPAVFLLIVEWTSGVGRIPIKLFLHNETRQVILSQHDINLVFIGAAVSGFLTAYYAILLFHRNFEYFRHCIGIGLTPSGFVSARFLFFLTVTITLAALITFLIMGLVNVKDPVLMFGGFLIIGTIYGTIGAIVGLLSTDIMVAILCIVLLANLDAGWLQNPVFYSSAQQTDIIHWLPAFYPTQVIFATAFTSSTNYWAFLMGGIYSVVLLAVLLGIIHLKIRNVKKWWNA